MLAPHFVKYMLGLVTVLLESSRASYYNRMTEVNDLAPYDGSYYLYSGSVDTPSYGLLMRTIDLRSAQTSALVDFFIWYKTEETWDNVLVEVCLDSDTCTTLPEINGHTSPDPRGLCEENWINELYAFPAHYQTVGKPCSNWGTTGSWNAKSGTSAGWEHWQFDLGDFIGSEISFSITYQTDWGSSDVGVYIDLISITIDDIVTATESFENG